METKDLIEVDERMNLEMEAFRKQFGIESIKFYKTVDFCSLILDGMPQTLAYVEAFNVEKKVAERTASQFHRGKWVQELLLFLRPNEHSLYFGQRKRIIQVGMQIIDATDSSNRDKIEAMKALQPFIKAEMVQSEEDNKSENVGETTSQSLSKKIELLAEKGLMISDTGDIIEVDVIE